MPHKIWHINYKNTQKIPKNEFKSKSLLLAHTSTFFNPLYVGFDWTRTEDTEDRKHSEIEMFASNAIHITKN